RPRQVPGELLEEEPCVDRATAARSDVVQIGDLALEVLAVLVDQRELPEPLARQLPRVEQPLRERLVVGHEAGAERAERDDAGTGQGRQVDHLIGLDARGGVAERVREREAPLGVGIPHLDRRAVHRAQHISRADRARSLGLSSFAGALMRSRAYAVARANTSPRRAPSSISRPWPASASTILSSSTARSGFSFL